MENIPFWLIPEKLLPRLQNHPGLHDMLDHVDAHHWSTMMTKIISHIIDKRDIPEHILSHIQKVHATYHVSEEQLTVFITSFMEALDEIGMTHDTTRTSIHDTLVSLSHRIFLNDDKLKDKVLCKIDELLYDIECYKDYADIRSQLHTIRLMLHTDTHRTTVT